MSIYLIIDEPAVTDQDLEDARPAAEAAGMVEIVDYIDAALDRCPACGRGKGDRYQCDYC